MSMTGELYRVTPQRLEELLDNPSMVESELFPYDYPANNRCSVEKAWNAIEFVLAQVLSEEEMPIGPLTGGATTGAILHYGPVWFRTADEVRAISNSLSAFTRVQFDQGYLPETMTELNVYPAEIWLRQDENNREYVWGWFCRLVAFYLEAAEAGDAMLLFLG